MTLLTFIGNITFIESVEAQLLKEHIAAKETHPLKKERVGYIDFFSLPPNYPAGYFSNEKCFTGELFSENPMAPLSDSNVLFVPKDYRYILASAFIHTLKAIGINVKKYSSIQEAKMDGASVLILGFPLVFHVESKEKAIVKISYKLFRLPQETKMWENIIESQFIYDHLPWSISEKTLVFMVGSHQFNFQPQRALLAFVSHKNTLELLARLNTIWNDVKNK